MSRRLPLLALALLLVLAGCTAPEAPSDEDVVSVSVTNEADRTYDVWVTVATRPFEAVAVTYRNGTTREYAVERIDQLAPGRFDGATNLTVKAETVQRHRYTVEPNTGIGATYTDVPADPAVVHFSRVRDGEAVRNVGVAGCGGGPGVTDLDITIRSDGSTEAETACTDRPSTADPSG
jgi:hypothetical protein